MQFFNVAIHQRDKLRLAAGDIVSERDAGVITGIDDQPAAKIANANPIARFKEHQRRTLNTGLPLAQAFLTDGDHIIKGNAMTVDGAVDNVTGHQFGQAGGVTLLVFITGGQDFDR
ncbi:Uncharacterised protein [Klebsiella aerogenes]|nr:Uncharacterised protein [Klebsiella aerogenes]